MTYIIIKIISNWQSRVKFAQGSVQENLCSKHHLATFGAMLPMLASCASVLKKQLFYLGTEKNAFDFQELDKKREIEAIRKADEEERKTLNQVEFILAQYHITSELCALLVPCVCQALNPF